ncbi:preprotein translocase subunit YajC [Anaerosporobacter faecicola]|uniref:preprotein translocase subunit YajC n=1 Tax=Anaerosporobacter faecicola TaxID=2718714 RepID=UPI00143A4BFC|nr:preprotein translocase subunit YajC [Anaerosporobacter faecicola]
MNGVILNTASNTAGGGMSIVFTLGYLLIIGVAFYFIAIRPQKKQQKSHAAMLTTVANGDSVLTSSGFYGVVIDVMEDVVILEFGNNKNCRIPMQKSAIIEIEKPEETK